MVQRPRGTRDFTPEVMNRRLAFEHLLEERARRHGFKRVQTNLSSQENILVLDGDKFIEDPVPVLRSVERFLNLPAFYSDQHFTFNGNSTPRLIF